ncbi:hypothetical protein BVY03_00750, partial [bacterium K02(2017)]
MLDSTAKNKFILLDRDGVLNTDRIDYVKTSQEMQVIESSCVAIKKLNAAGYKVLVITNQGCIAKGIITEDVLTEIHSTLLKRVKKNGGEISKIYYCPHHDQNQCDCRKPKPGLIEQAQRDWGFDPKQTWMVGDSNRDVLA